MGDVKVESFLRVLFALGFMSVQQLSVTDAEIDMYRNGITTVGKTFRVVCKVTNERFVGWYDLNDNRVTKTKFPDEEQLPEEKYYVEVQSNSYTLVIQKVAVADGGNYTCRGDKTIKVFTLYVEFFVTEFPLDQDLFVGRSQVIRCSADGYPKPTFKWYKKRRLVKFSDPRFTLLSNGSLLINPVHESDTAEYICRITQLGTEEGTNLREESRDIQVTVYGPPRINLEKSSSSELFSYIDNPSPVTIICYWWGYPVPSLDIKKNNKALASDDVKVDGPRLEATVKIDSEDDFGSYTCHASNRFGDATYDISVMKAGKPSPPINITFATTCDHLTVAWKQPESDGGLPLTRYKIELRDEIELLDEVFVGVQTMRFTFTSKEGVNPRTSYTVAVQAFNKLNNGTKGERAVMSAYCPPSGPFNITNTVTQLNATSFTLKWTRPPQNGGDPDLKYDIEYSKANAEGKFVHWNSRKSITGQEYNVTGLERESRYQFKVFVFNIAGRKREPASKEFSVIGGRDDDGPRPTTGPGGLGINQPDLVYDMSINCTSFYMQVNFALKSSYLNVETFHFDNTSCGSYVANSTHVTLRTPLDACGTTSRQSEDSVTYFNKVVAETKDRDKGYVVEFPFSCTYNRRETIGTPSFQPRKKVTVFEEGYGNFSFEMGLYRSSEYASPYDVSEYPVTINPFGQLYCQAKLDSSDPDLVLWTDTCVATPSLDPSHSVQYTFIEDGCPVDNGTRYIHTMTDTQRFQLIPFRWIRNYTLVYLHCNVIVCHKDQPSRCSKGCQPSSPRRTRSTGNEEEHRVTLGPVMLRGTQRSESRIVYKDPHLSSPVSSSFPLWMIILIIVATAVGLCLMLFVGVHLFYFIASKSQAGGMTEVQRHSEEVELFRSENV